MRQKCSLGYNHQKIESANNYIRNSKSIEKAKLTISKAFEILIMKKNNTLDLDSYRKTDLEMFSRAINLSSLD